MDLEDAIEQTARPEATGRNAIDLHTVYRVKPNNGVCFDPEVFAVIVYAYDPTTERTFMVAADSARNLMKLETRRKMRSEMQKALREEEVLH